MIDDLFALNPARQVRVEFLSPAAPVVLVDEFYARADQVRAAALQLPFAPASLHYPGRIADAPPANSSLASAVEWVRDVANQVFLGLVPMTFEQRPVTSFREVRTDFAIVDRHPSELGAAQRVPHVDPVPLFGLVYLNREERGGTLFFERTGEGSAADDAADYFHSGDDRFRAIGRIAPVFNRLAIYPGSVPHTGEIVGDWIRSDARFTSPRLTQRLLFAP